MTQLTVSNISAGQISLGQYVGTLARGETKVKNLTVFELELAVPLLVVATKAGFIVWGTAPSEDEFDDDGEFLSVEDTGTGGGGGAVDSVNGQVAAVVLTLDDIADGGGRVLPTTTDAAEASAAFAHIADVNNPHAVTAAQTGAVPTGDVANANGVASLDGAGLVPSSQLSFSSLSFQGTWDATGNVPALASGVGVDGQYYVVSNGGTINLDGNGLWAVGEAAAFSGTTGTWHLLPATDAGVITWNGTAGNVVADADDIAETAARLWLTAGERVQIAASVASDHTHANKAIIDGITDVGSGAIITAVERASLATVVGAGDLLTYVGDWDAATNTPALADGVGTTGEVYQVSVAGATSLDGITDWAVGDLFLFDDNSYVKMGSGGGAELVAQTLTDTTTIAWDMSLGEYGIVTVAADRTFEAPTNLPTNGMVFLRINCDATDRTIDFDFPYVTTSGLALSSTVLSAGSSSLFSFYSDGTTLFQISGPGAVISPMGGATLAAAGTAGTVPLPPAAAHNLPFHGDGTYKGILGGWSASTTVSAGQLVFAENRIWSSDSARTTGLAFDLSENSEWTELSEKYQSQVLVEAAPTDWSTYYGRSATLTLTADNTLGIPTLLDLGHEYTLLVTSTGNFNLTFPTFFKDADGADMPVQAITVAAPKAFHFVYTGSSMQEVSLSTVGPIVAQVLTDAASIAWDVDSGNYGIVGITADRAFAAPTNLPTNEMMYLRINNLDAAERDVSFGAPFVTSLGTAIPDLPLGSGASAFLSFYSDGASLFQTSGAGEMTGATALLDGTGGTAPIPTLGQQGLPLHGDATYKGVANAWVAATTYSAGQLATFDNVIYRRTAAGTSTAAFNFAESAFWDRLGTALNTVDLADAVSITWDAFEGTNANVSLTADRAMANPTNLVAGEIYSLMVEASGADRTLSFGGDFFSAEYEAMTDVTIDSGTWKVFQWAFDGTRLVEISSAGGLAKKGVVTSDADAGEGIYSLDASGAAFDFTLPAATGSQERRMFFANDVETNATTIGVQAGENLSGVTNGTFVSGVNGEIILAVDRANGEWEVSALNAKTGEETFIVADWSAVVAGVSTLLITAVVHGKGINPVVTLQEGTGPFAPVAAHGMSISATGDITLTVTAGEQFDGRLLIS